MIIQLHGFKGAGKDTLAEYLVKNLKNAKQYSYANYLKQKPCEMTGLSLLDIELYKRTRVEFESIRYQFPECESATVREALIFLSESTKEIYGRDIFIKKVDEEIARNKDVDFHIISDLRYKNEYDYFDSLLITIDRQVCKNDLESENQLTGERFDVYLNNNGTKEEFEKECRVVFDLLA